MAAGLSSAMAPDVTVVSGKTAPSAHTFTVSPSRWSRSDRDVTIRRTTPPLT